MAPVVTVTLGSDHVEAECKGTRHNKEGLEAQAIDACAYDPDEKVFRVRPDAFEHTWMVGTGTTIVLKGAL